MYDIIKQEYLDSILKDNEAVATKNYLAVFERAIESLGLDVLDIDIDDLYSVISESGYYNMNTMRVYITALRKFLLYIFKTNPTLMKKLTWDQALELKVRDVDLVSAIKRNLFISFEEIRPCFAERNIESGRYNEVAWALIWAGLNIKEILELKNADVVGAPDRSGSGEIARVRVGKNYIYVDDISASEVILDYKAKTESKSYWEGTDITIIDHGFFLKKFKAPKIRCSETPLSRSAFQRNLSITSGEPNEYMIALGKPLRIENVVDSGKYQRMHAKVLSGMSEDDAILEEFGKLDVKYILDKKSMYRCYKIAFGL